MNKTVKRAIGYLCATALILFFVGGIGAGITTALFAWPISDPEAVRTIREAYALIGGLVTFMLVVFGALWGLELDERSEESES